MTTEEHGLESVMAPMPTNFAECAGLPAERFLYHEPPMVLLEQVAEVGSDSARCTCLVDSENPFFISDLGVPGWIGVEFMAQCIAVMAGARAVISGDPLPVGLLLGTMHYRCAVNAFDSRERYTASCRTLLRETDGLGSFDCAISTDSGNIASARLTVKELTEGAPNNV